jgi:hypothetical protein
MAERINSYPMVMREPGEVDGLPAPLPGVVYVVSALVPQAVPGWEDVVSPDTGAAFQRET